VEPVGCVATLFLSRRENLAALGEVVPQHPATMSQTLVVRALAVKVLQGERVDITPPDLLSLQVVAMARDRLGKITQVVGAVVTVVTGLLRQLPVRLFTALVVAVVGTTQVQLDLGGLAVAVTRLLLALQSLGPQILGAALGGVETTTATFLVQVGLVL